MALKDIVLVIVLYLNVSPTPCNSVAIDTFYAQPSNPKIGSTIELGCVAFNPPPVGGIDFILSKDGQILTRNGDFIDEEFGNRTDTTVTFLSDKVDLTIESISRSDNGTYTCILFDGNILVDERSVTTKVLYYPSSWFPLCSFKTGHIDNNVTLSCLSETGNPPVSLIWTTTVTDKNALGETALTTTGSEIDQNGFLTSEISLQYSQIRITDTFTCSVNSSEFSYKQNCTIQAESTLRADIRPSRFSANVYDEAEFDCVVHVPNNTKPLRWLWLTEPQIQQSRWFSDESAFSINPTLAKDNGTLISCYALFDDYWLQAHAELVVVFNQTESRNETVNNPRGIRADSNIGWIGAFVAMTIVCAVIAGIAICLYRKVRQNETSTLAQRDVSVHRVQSVVEQRQANVNDTPDDEYQDVDLSIEQNIVQEEYTELNNNILSAGKDQESNSGLGKDNKNMQKGGKELCYDYAETNVYERPNEDSSYITIIE